MNGGTDLDALRAEVRIWAALLLIFLSLSFGAIFAAIGALELGVIFVLGSTVWLSAWYCERFDGWNRRFWRLFYKKEDGQYIGDHLPKGDER